MGLYDKLPKVKKLTKWEKFILFFITPLYASNQSEGTWMITKQFRKTIYIIDSGFLPPKHWNCRCVIETND